MAMPSTFMRSSSYLFTSESVTEGHPDKICDQISDAVLDAYVAKDPEARVDCKVIITGGQVVIVGEVTALRLVADPPDAAPTVEPCLVDAAGIARRVIEEVGYTSAERFFDARTCGITVILWPQSPEIAQAVGPTEWSDRGRMTDEKLARLGAGDQGMMVGYACDETEAFLEPGEFMPLPIALAHRVTRRLAEVRKQGVLDFLYPDGKAQVTIEYRLGQPVRVAKILVAAQHSRDVIERQGEQEGMSSRAQQAIIEEVIRNVVPPALLPGSTLEQANSRGTWRWGEATIAINTSAVFHRGGPIADAGLTGRKIIVDTYGGMARHGGGAFSGKDATKVDRSASYAARYIAKNIVAAKLAKRCEVLLSYAIGVAEPVSFEIETFGTATVPDERLAALVRDHFDLRPGAIIRDLGLWRPIYRQTATYGHFGRPDLELPWERTDRAQVLAATAAKKTALC